MVEFIVQNWEQAYNQVYALFEKIVADKYTPDIIIGIARGGWIPARLLSDFFKTKATANVKVEAYQMIGEMEPEAKITQSLTISLEGKSVLIVDDIADSGSSLSLVTHLVKSKNPKSFKTATIYSKPRSIIQPDYVIQSTDAWVIFSWEYYESIHELSETWESNGLSRSEILQKLKQIGIPTTIVNSYYSN